MRRFKNIKRTAVFGLVTILIGICNLIPRRFAVFIGGWLGLASWVILKRDRYKTERHLALVYAGIHTPAEMKNIGRQFFVNSGKNIVDVLRFKKHFASEIRPFITVEGIEHWVKAFNRGRGVFGVTGHIGNFEVLAALIASLGYPVAVIGREMYDKRLDTTLIENRASVGLTNISTSDSPRKLIEWLKKGGVVGVLIDTDSGRVRNCMIPTFGRLANTPVGQSMLGLRLGSAFVPAVCLRTPDNRYRVIIKEEVCINPSGDAETDAIELTKKCTEVLELIIHENKDQWIWLHNRWKTPVNSEPDIKSGLIDADNETIDKNKSLRDI
ncbi:MAG: lysophospholipid acyltransferase family protein [candidate division Zixibacteria bacterium]|nr:lysophospholipid acyltransferase family protein [candidate division Zixibacteria bacterium]